MNDETKRTDETQAPAQPLTDEEASTAAGGGPYFDGVDCPKCGKWFSNPIVFSKHYETCQGK